MKWSTFDNKEVTTSSRNWFYQEEWSSHLLSWHIKKACWHCKVVLCILCKGQTKLRKHKRPCLSEKVPLRGARDHPNVINRIVWAEALQPLALVNCMFLFLFSFSYLYLYLHLFLYLYLYFYVDRIVRTGTLQVATSSSCQLHVPDLRTALHLHLYLYLYFMTELCKWFLKHCIATSCQLRTRSESCTMRLKMVHCSEPTRRFFTLQCQ